MNLSKYRLLVIHYNIIILVGGLGTVLLLIAALEQELVSDGVPKLLVFITIGTVSTCVVILRPILVRELATRLTTTEDSLSGALMGMYYDAKLYVSFMPVIGRFITRPAANRTDRALDNRPIEPE